MTCQRLFGGFSVVSGGALLLQVSGRELRARAGGPSDAESREAKVLDFGISSMLTAASMETSLTGTGAVLGTPP